MAFYPLDRLRQGDVDFLYHFTEYDLKSVESQIRHAEDKREIIDIILPKLLKTRSAFCFEIIYDDDKYEKQTKYLLNKGFQFTEDKILNLLYNTTWGIKYIINNSEEIFNIVKPDNIHLLIDGIYQEHKDKIKYFVDHSNLHIRYLFMLHILTNYEEDFTKIYGNLLKHISSITYKKYEQLTLIPDLMPIEDICNLCRYIFKSNLKDIYYEPLKEYILKTYPTNDLAKSFLQRDQIPAGNHCFQYREDINCTNEFKKNINEFFTTSRNYQFYIYNNYKEDLAKEILEDFTSKIAMFQDRGYYDIIHIYDNGLGKKLVSYIDKYLSLSNTEDTYFIGSGTTCSSYRIGDYCLKLVHFKWSYEDIICPNLYLIAPNLEEDYVRNRYGHIESGIEVQHYYPKSAVDIPREILDEYKKELSRLGYFTTDTLMFGSCGDNCRLLNSYKDALCSNPEKLPEWFKQYPLILVDRDRVYSNNNKHYKQLNSHY